MGERPQSTPFLPGAVAKGPVVPSISVVLQRPPHLDLVEHLKFLHKQVIPLFFLISVLIMVAFIVVRAGQQGVDLPAPGSEPDPIGFLRVGKEVDPAFDLLSPIEMVLAPGAKEFIEPLASSPALAGAEPGSGRLVRAAADGWVVTAANGTSGSGVVLLHDRGDAVVETIYEGLGSIRVGVGVPVRRGDPLGTVAEGRSLRFRVRNAPLTGLEMLAGETTVVPDSWRAPAERLAPPPSGEAAGPGALKLEEAPPAVPAK
jgi:hypothetical protein